MDAPMTRRRSGSLELDYGGEDDPLQDQELEHAIKPEAEEDRKPKPIATLEAARKELVESKPVIAPLRPLPTTSTSVSNLPSGLPANPLTGRIPSGGPGSSVLAGSIPGMATAGGATQSNTSQMTAIFVSDMHWWTSDQHLVELCHLAGAGNVKVKDVSFSEHKVNGKSKGVAYIETGSVEGAALVKRYVDSNEYQQKRMTCTLVIGSNLGSPFRTLPREPHQRNQPSGSSYNPANQSSRPGLRIPPPCTYPYINSRDNGPGGNQGGGMNQHGGGQQKRQYGNGPGQASSAGGLGMGMGMTSMTGQSYGGGGSGGGSRNQQQNSPNYPIQAPALPQQQSQSLANVGSMAGMGGMGGGMNAMGGMGFGGGGGLDGMNMYGMNPFAGMGGMNMMGGFNPAAAFGVGMGGMGGMGGFDMSQFAGAGPSAGMDFGQMTQYGAGNGQQHGQGNGAAKRSRTDG
ncbi:hypothetical protein JCM11491_000759 [Sporobolomyces phaffii]